MFYPPSHRDFCLTFFVSIVLMWQKRSEGSVFFITPGDCKEPGENRTKLYRSPKGVIQFFNEFHPSIASNL